MRGQEIYQEIYLFLQLNLKSGGLETGQLLKGGVVETRLRTTDIEH